MDNYFSNIKERILCLADTKGYKKEEFFKVLGLSYGNFKGENKKRPINSNALADIITLIPDVNAEWLLTGNGEMLKDKATTEVFANNILIDLRKQIKYQESINKELKNEIKNIQKTIAALHK